MYRIYCYRTIYMEFLHDESREFIELLAHCRKLALSEEKLDESLKRLLDPLPFNWITLN